MMNYQHVTSNGSQANRHGSLPPSRKSLAREPSNKHSQKGKYYLKNQAVQVRVEEVTLPLKPLQLLGKFKKNKAI
jgi:hypothetical protein